MSPIHTPGPWVVEVPPRTTKLVVSHYSHKGGEVIADLQCDMSGKPDPRKRANARLVSAAPDLLAALLIEVGRLEALGSVPCIEARAAIAKAKGEAAP